MLLWSATPKSQHVIQRECLSHPSVRGNVSPKSFRLVAELFLILNRFRWRFLQQIGVAQAGKAAPAGPHELLPLPTADRLLAAAGVSHVGRCESLLPRCVANLCNVVR